MIKNFTAQACDHVALLKRAAFRLLNRLQSVLHSRDRFMAATVQSRRPKFKSRFPTVLTAGFRFFFLAAGLFSVAAMAVWTLWLAALAGGDTLDVLPVRMMPYLWHAHEMMFGYTAAVIAGFFVTAVPNWTATEEAGPRFVTICSVIWLSGRMAIWFSAWLDPFLVVAVDLAFIPVLSTAILGRLTQKSQLRNAIFLLLLCTLFAGNLLMHLDWVGWSTDLAETGVRLGIFTSAAMIAIIGGRVIPAFTRNALNREGYSGALPQSYGWLDRIGILSAVLTALATLPFVPPWGLGALCLVAGSVNLARLTGWQGLATRKNPILWILHVAYLLLSAGYLVYGSTLVFGILSETASLHLLAAGAIGCMTLAMMTRASLGHSGRPLVVSGPIVLAYLMVIGAAVFRTFGTMFFDYFPVMLISGTLWLLAFAVFAWVFYPILTRPRPARQSS